MKNIVLNRRLALLATILVMSISGVLIAWTGGGSSWTRGFVICALLLEGGIAYALALLASRNQRQFEENQTAYEDEHRLRLYLEGSLDSVQNPITVTDMDMKWVFVNKVTESLLKAQGLDKQSVLGKHCSNWKADICGTSNCGIASLRQGRPQTNYNQEYPDRPSTYMQVDTSYILDDSGNRIGHVEIVSNIDAANKLKTTSEQISSSLEETSASLEEMSSITSQTADNCRKVSQLMDNSDTHVKEANRLMGVFTNAMNQISVASQETSRIVKTIDEISFQTNILALNAAVEAARAGEAGAGFAVVADEVRNLAMRAAESSRNTAELIDKTVAKVKEGSDLLSQTNQSFSEVVKSTEQSKTRISEIAAASNEQSLGIKQITAAVMDMNNVIQSTISGDKTGETKSNSKQEKAVVRSIKSHARCNSQQKGCCTDKSIEFFDLDSSAIEKSF
jgi:uncharacterized coiled-coil DUF342 family protein